jgi:hypothetical protein
MKGGVQTPWILQLDPPLHLTRLTFNMVENDHVTVCSIVRPFLGFTRFGFNLYWLLYSRIKRHSVCTWHCNTVEMFTEKYDAGLIILRLFMTQSHCPSSHQPDRISKYLASGWRRRLKERKVNINRLNRSAQMISNSIDNIAWDFIIGRDYRVWKWNLDFGLLS